MHKFVGVLDKYDTWWEVTEAVLDLPVYAPVNEHLPHPPPLRHCVAVHARLGHSSTESQRPLLPLRSKIGWFLVPGRLVWNAYCNLVPRAFSALKMAQRGGARIETPAAFCHEKHKKKFEWNYDPRSVL